MEESEWGTEQLLSAVGPSPIIEARWRSLKHQWLYLHSLDSVVGVQRLVASPPRLPRLSPPPRAAEGTVGSALGAGDWFGGARKP